MNQPVSGLPLFRIGRVCSSTIYCAFLIGTVFVRLIQSHGDLRFWNAGSLPAREEITVNLDYRQNGIGRAGCGAGVLPQYQLKAENFDFNVTMKPLKA